ncbi:hypothetical protein FGO68_gene14641 [Halteria grandinella]|uniref:Uncharacterized protein n=1 Tax=Halteria grandinella TaxID=5974 RepID=A0A8J8N9R0_HALGN|nr:hypothetical protein FGO68_gene14641 [Halteria grandinella]
MFCAFLLHLLNWNHLFLLAFLFIYYSRFVLLFLLAYYVAFYQAFSVGAPSSSDMFKTANKLLLIRFKKYFNYVLPQLRASKESL